MQGWRFNSSSNTEQDYMQELEKRAAEIEQRYIQDYLEEMAYKHHIQGKIVDLLILIKETCYELQKHI